MTEDLSTALVSAADALVSRTGAAGPWGPILEPTDEGRSALRRGLAELGLISALVPEAQGGLGIARVDLAGVLDRLGTVLAPGPFVEATAVLPWLRAADVDAARTAADAIAAGEAEVVVAGCEAVRWDPSEPGVAFRAGPVAHGAGADWLVVPGPTEGPEALAVPLGADGVEVRPVDGDDPCGRHAWITVAAASRPQWLELDGPGTWVELEADVHAASAARLAGVASRVVDAAVTYSLQREQFDRPIAAFQAVQHLLADMAASTDAARNLARVALARRDAGDPEAADLALAALVHAVEVAVDTTEGSLQVHGGIGFTVELPLHRFLSHATSVERLHGGRLRMRRRMGRRVVAARRTS